LATKVDQTTQDPRSAEEERLIALRKRDARRKWFWRITGYVVILGMWEFLSGRILSENLFPGPIRIVETLGELVDFEPWTIWVFVGGLILTLILMAARVTGALVFGIIAIIVAIFVGIATGAETGRFLESYASTLTRIGIGFGLSFLFGVALGIAMQNRWITGFFRDGVTISLVSPGLVWALTGLIIWGFKPMGWIFAIFLTTVALVTINIAEGVRALPKDLMDMSKAFGVSQSRRQKEIVIPALAPFLFTALRFGFAIAWKVTVLTEVFSANAGIGFEMRIATQLFRMDEFFAWALSFFIFALILEKVILQYYETRFFRWREEVAT